MDHPIRPVSPPPALVDLAGKLGSLIEVAARVGSLPPEAEALVHEGGAAIERLAEALDAHASHDAVPRMGPEPAAQRPYFTNGVVMGPHHPLRPALEIGHDAGTTSGEVEFGIAFEGPPGCVHGGYVAHFFDQVLGQHNLYSEVPAMTGTLTVRYLAGTPLLRRLGFRVTHRADGPRKVRTTGALFDAAAPDTVFAEGEGIFVVPRGGVAPPTR